MKLGSGDKKKEVKKTEPPKPTKKEVVKDDLDDILADPFGEDSSPKQPIPSKAKPEPKKEVKKDDLFDFGDDFVELDYLEQQCRQETSHKTRCNEFRGLTTKEP